MLAEVKKKQPESVKLILKVTAVEWTKCSPYKVQKGKVKEEASA